MNTLQRLQGTFRGVVSGALGAVLLASAAPSALAGSEYWIFDGTTHAQVNWYDGTFTDDPNEYFSFGTPAHADSAVMFADGHARSAEGSVSADTFVVGTAGNHSVLASGRGANSLYGLEPGWYKVSFGYDVGPHQQGLIIDSSEVGYETPGPDFTIDASGGGTYTALVHLDSWISFYATAQSSSVQGTGTTYAKLFDISVTAASPAPEPETLWLSAAGIAVLAARVLGKERRGQRRS